MLYLKCGSNVVECFIKCHMEAFVSRLCLFLSNKDALVYTGSHVIGNYVVQTLMNNYSKDPRCKPVIQVVSPHQILKENLEQVMKSDSGYKMVQNLHWLLELKLGLPQKRTGNGGQRGQNKTRGGGNAFQKEAGHGAEAKFSEKGQPHYGHLGHQGYQGNQGYQAHQGQRGQPVAFYGQPSYYYPNQSPYGYGYPSGYGNQSQFQVPMVMMPQTPPPAQPHHQYPMNMNVNLNVNVNYGQKNLPPGGYNYFPAEETQVQSGSRGRAGAGSSSTAKKYNAPRKQTN